MDNDAVILEETTVTSTVPVLEPEAQAVIAANQAASPPVLTQISAEGLHNVSYKGQDYKAKIEGGPKCTRLLVRLDVKPPNQAGEFRCIVIPLSVIAAKRAIKNAKAKGIAVTDLNPDRLSIQAILAPHENRTQPVRRPNTTTYELWAKKHLAQLAVSRTVTSATP